MAHCVTSIFPLQGTVTERPGGLKIIFKVGKCVKSPKLGTYAEMVKQRNQNLP